MPVPTCLHAGHQRRRAGAASALLALTRAPTVWWPLGYKCAPSLPVAFFIVVSAHTIFLVPPTG